jgi:hypothetical protein
MRPTLPLPLQWAWDGIQLKDSFAARQQIRLPIQQTNKEGSDHRDEQVAGPEKR